MALLSAFLVVVIHSISDLSIDSRFLNIVFHDSFCRVAVPFFFFASGFFIANDVGTCSDWGRALGKRIRTLVVPYLFFVISYWLLRNGLHVIVNLVVHNATLEGVDLSFPRILTNWGLSAFAHPLLSPAWYIRGLLALVVLSPVLLRVARLRWAGLLLMLALYGAVGPWEGIDGRWVYFFRKTVPLQGAFYLAWGMAVRIGAVRVLSSNRTVAQSICAAGFGLMLLNVLLQYQGVPYHYYAGFLSVPLLLVGLLNLVPDGPLPKWIATASFPVYMIHLFVIMFLKNLFQVLDFDLNRHLGLWWIVPPFVFATSVAMAVFIRRLYPKVASVIFGGR